MSNRDMSVDVLAVPSISPASHAATIEGEIVDLQGSEKLLMVVMAGIIATSTGSHYMTFTVETGDESNLSDAAAVAAGDYLNPLGVANTAWDRLINATTEGSKTYQVGIKNSAGKRYGRIVATETGTFTGIFGAALIKGTLRNSPQA